jgi:hypothetical protein
MDGKKRAYQGKIRYLQGVSHLEVTHKNGFGFPVFELKCTQYSTREVKHCSQHLPPVLGSVDSLFYRLGIAESNKM